MKIPKRENPWASKATEEQPVLTVKAMTIACGLTRHLQEEPWISARGVHKTGEVSEFSLVWQDACTTMHVDLQDNITVEVDRHRAVDEAQERGDAWEDLYDRILQAVGFCRVEGASCILDVPVKKT